MNSPETTIDTPAPAVSAYAFEGFRLAVPERRLYKGDDLVPLGAKACDVLLLLVSRAGELVGKDEILSQVWPDAHVTDDSLKQTVSVLRRALGEDPDQPQFIATTPRRGYKFIAQVQTEPVHGPAPAPAIAPSAARRPIPIGAAAIVLLVVAIAVIAWLAPSPPSVAADPTPVRFEHVAPAGTTLASGGALAPDGSHLAFTARDSATGRTSLWVRTLASSQSRQLPGTEGAFRPFWSPDSRYLAFFADGRLKKVGLAGGAPQSVASVGYRPAGGTWSRSGVLLYSDRGSRLYGVSEGGDGKVFPVTTLDVSRQEIAHRGAQFLPDGRKFLFQIGSADAAQDGTYVASLDDPALRHLLLDSTAAHVTFAAPAHLIYLRDQTLMAQPFDPVGLRLTGPGVPLGGLTTRSRIFSVGGGGLLAFGGETIAQQLSWFDRTGRALGALTTSTDLHNPALTPDGRQLVADGNGIWVVDLDRGTPTRVGSGTLPSWGPDGDAVVFTRRAATGADVVLKAIAGVEHERILVRSKEMMLSGDWSRDGRHFVYVGSNAESRLDIWLLDSPADEPARPFLQTGANEMQPRISPDGRWIAYTSDETGSWEVYVQSFPAAGSKRTVSLNGGAEPQWTKNGDELIYLRPDGTLMAVAVETGAETVQPGTPEPLFRVALGGDITTYRNNFAVTADGARFLADTADESTREALSIVVHWEQLLPR